VAPAVGDGELLLVDLREVVGPAAHHRDRRVGGLVDDPRLLRHRDGAGGRGEDHPADAALPGTREESPGGVHVESVPLPTVGGIEGDQARQVVEHLLALQRLPHPLGVIETSPKGLSAPQLLVIHGAAAEDAHVMTRADEALDELQPQEARSAGDQDLHAAPPSRRAPGVGDSTVVADETSSASEGSSEDATTPREAAPGEERVRTRPTCSASTADWA